MKCLWEIFTEAILPILVAIFGVYVAEHFARKRDYKQKEIEIQIDYMQKEIEYLSEMENLVLELSRQVDNCLITRDPNKKMEKYNLTLRQLSQLNNRNLTLYYRLDCFNKAMNLEIDIEQYKKAIGTCSNTLKEICDKYICEPISQQSEEEINEQISIVRKVIEDAIKLITDKMSYFLQIYDNEKGEKLWMVKFRGR